MKTMGKVNLKSSLYKQAVSNIIRQKSPRERTPRSITPTLTHNTNTAKKTETNTTINKTYQNVCCPSCRYFFRVPKEEIINKIVEEVTETKVKEYVKINFLNNCRTVEIQTDSAFTNHKSTAKMQKSNHKNRLSNKSINQFEIYENFNHRSPISPSGHIIRTNRTSTSHFPTRSAYLENTQNDKNVVLSPNKDINDNYDNDKGFLKLSKFLPASPQKQYHNAKVLQNKDVNQLMDVVVLNKQISSIIDFNLQLPSQADIPSYCKMLVYQLDQRRTQFIKKHKKQLTFQSLQDEDYCR